MINISLFDLQNIILVFIITLFFDLFLDRTKSNQRFIYGMIVVFFGYRYLSWRLLETLHYDDGGVSTWSISIFVIEIFGCLSGLIFILIMSKAPSRVPAKFIQPHEHSNPTVDFLIPTYNEPVEILDKSIIAALKQDYPQCRVIVLDDGRRDWVKQLCAELGAEYLTRSDNSHAKAGNLNAALKHCNGDLVAIMDADFAASQNFLKTAIPLFADPQVGVVQTPQVFYNPDLIQLNLAINNEWVDEQRLFFREIMPARARWNAAFSCGSCSVTRRAALDTIGGFPVESITEDMLTTLRLRRFGFQTVYLNDNLSLGLSADAADSYFTQRNRWARGHIQIAYLWRDYLGNKSISLFQKIIFFPHHWFIMPLVSIMVSLIPFLYYLFGWSPTTKGGLSEALGYAAPFFAIQQGYMTWIGNRKYVPLISSAINVFTAYKLFPSVLSSLVKPFGVPFRVTPKSIVISQGYDLWTSGILGSLWIGTLFGMILNTFSDFRLIPVTDFFPVALIFSTITMINLTIAFWISIPRPYPRMSFRFHIGTKMHFRTQAGNYSAYVDNMSTGGVSIKSDINLLVGGKIEIQLTDNVWIPGRIVRVSDNVGIRWDPLSRRDYRSLVEFLFSGQFSSNPESSSDFFNIFGKLIRSI